MPTRSAYITGVEKAPVRIQTSNQLVPYSEIWVDIQGWPLPQKTETKTNRGAKGPWRKRIYSEGKNNITTINILREMKADISTETRKQQHSENQKETSQFKKTRAEMKYSLEELEDKVETISQKAKEKRQEMENRFQRVRILEDQSRRSTIQIIKGLRKSEHRKWEREGNQRNNSTKRRELSD